MLRILGQIADAIHDAEANLSQIHSEELNDQMVRELQMAARAELGLEYIRFRAASRAAFTQSDRRTGARRAEGGTRG